MTEPIVNILLATYQGEAYLKAQLDSLAAQTYPHWRLYVSDDGSTDSTLNIIKEFSQTTTNSVTIFHGPCKGVTRNFLNLISKMDSYCDKDLYAFCDQDDVWLPEKLNIAVQHYKKQTLKASQPYLYCSSTNIVDANLNFKSLSQKRPKPPSFGNALVQNIASGNTMIFNDALLNLMKRIRAENVVIHDWLAYQLATGCDGVVYYDHSPQVLYRQHNSNLIGSNSGLMSRFSRLQGLLGGEIKRWANQTEAAMESISQHLSSNALEQFIFFKKIRWLSNLWIRLVIFYKSNLIRQTQIGRISLLMAVVFKLI
jgi:glycosyltransferase involved in cell wall biosynthesis